jgi:hypothetical protein
VLLATHFELLAFGEGKYFKLHGDILLFLEETQPF